MRMTRAELAKDFHEHTHGRYQGITHRLTPTRLWEEAQALRPFLFLAWAPIGWVLDRYWPEK